MLITRDFVFVHLPKTGGDFVRVLCKQHLPEGSIIPVDLVKHAFDRRIPPEYRHLPRFGLIRNPWSWYVSWYHYLLGSGRTEEHKARVDNPDWSHVTDNGSNFDFERIVTRLATGDVSNANAAEQMRNQDIDLLTFLYLATFKNGLQNDHITIGKTESLRIDFPAFLAANDIRVPESFLTAFQERKKLNVTKHAPYQEHYSDELRELVRHKARLIIERYDYDFETLPSAETAPAPH